VSTQPLMPPDGPAPDHVAPPVPAVELPPPHAELHAELHADIGEPAQPAAAPVAAEAPATADATTSDGMVHRPMGPTGRPMPLFPEPAPRETHGPARIIAMCNQKGGVGKTTTTINLGAALAEYGRKVLLVDFDPQGSLSVGLGVNPYDIDKSVYDLIMTRDVTLDDVVLKSNVPGLDIVPSNIDLSAAEVQLVTEVAREQVLTRALAPAVAEYDFIIIDCQPSLGLLTVNALTAANGVIVPMEAEFFALRGVAMLVETIQKVQDRLNPGLEIDGLVATMFDSRTVHSREVLARLVEAFDEKVFHTAIARTVRFPETTVAGEPITTFATSSGGAYSYRQLAKEVLARCPGT
jgi:chromosome partitioning protein